MKVTIMLENGGEFQYEGKGIDLLKDVSMGLSKLNGIEEYYKAIKSKAEKWDELADKISKFYPEDDDEKTGDLLDIGEVAAMAFGFM